MCSVRLEPMGRMRMGVSNFESRYSGSSALADSSSNISVHSFANRSISRMSAWIPAETELTTGSIPEAPGADLTGEEPLTTAEGSCTAIRWMERGGIVGTGAGVDVDVTGGGGTRVYMRGRSFSFP